MYKINFNKTNYFERLRSRVFPAKKQTDFGMP